MKSSITEFVGVYDADSTLLGEFSYWIGARFGRAHCSLCDLTHGLFSVKDEWKRCERSLGVPFTTFHRNDAPADVLAAVRGEFPAVLVRREAGVAVVLTSAQLARFAGSTAEFTLWLHDFLGSD